MRHEDSTTDELALFFVPKTDDADSLDTLCRNILHLTARTAGIAAKHLVPLMAADFSLTSASKIRGDALANSYQRGAWKANEMKPAGGSDSSYGLANCEKWLTELWKKTLKLDFFPSRDDNFFELGGDSLASAEVIFAVEEQYFCVLPIESFFQVPTIATLAALIGTGGADLFPESAQPAIGGI